MKERAISLLDLHAEFFLREFRQALRERMHLNMTVTSFRVNLALLRGDFDAILNESLSYLSTVIEKVDDVSRVRDDEILGVIKDCINKSSQ